MTAAKDSGKVNIHGREYETVASRVQRFRAEHKDKYGIITEIIDRDDKLVVMKATIGAWDGTDLDVASSWHPVATGFAEESRTSSSINRTSALENAETSAIGRALANFGMAGTEYASADEVAQAIGQRQTSAPRQENVGANGYATDAQRRKVARILKLRGYETPEAQKAKLESMGETTPLSVGAASRVIDKLEGGKA